MKKYVFYILLPILLLSSSCGKRSQVSEGIPGIDLTGKLDTVTYSIDDLIRDVRMIRLETNEQSLLSNFQGFVGDNVVLAVSDNKVLQFDGQGNYLRTITRKGPGPMEFNYFDAWTVDEHGRYFFYHDLMKHYIKRYNLVTGNFEKDIPFDCKGYISGLLTVNDTLLAILPNRLSSYDYQYFYQTIDGKIIDGMKKDTLEEPGEWTGLLPVFSKGSGDIIYLQPEGEDTVYEVRNNQKKPCLYFNTPQSVKRGNETSGTYGSLLYPVGDLIFIHDGTFIRTVMQYGKTTRMNSITGVYNRKSGDLQLIDSLLLHFEGMALANRGFDIMSDKRFVMPFQALQIKAALKEALKNQETPKDQVMKLKMLDKQISENDNPVLITGKIRID